MEDKIILKLIDAALSGNENLGQIAVRQFASKIRTVNSILYQDITNRLQFVATRSTGLKSKPLPLDADTRQTLVRVEDPILLDTAPVFASDVEESLEQILLERRHTEELLREGIFPARSVIFKGAPGVGKTMSARWLAKNLGLPLFTLDLATVMSSFLGKTGSNVRAVLEHAMSTPCVLLLDEFDAIAKRRDDDRELGELKRLVTVLLQAIDDWPPNSLLIAATNHSELLDPAIWRRFDVEIEFPMPSIEIIEKYLVEYWPEALKSGRIAKHFAGMSFSNIDRELRQAKRESIISNFNLKIREANTDGISMLTDKDLSSMSKEERNNWIIRLHKKGESQRSISSILNISRPTVKKVLEENIQA
ncbi:ATP-binding protein [Alkalimonas collagenimarina]|uniref:ATP-binding protein n=1 Tax=Alkalimonas collagenimarina TaxID=400390 RepID=A0ABT9GWR6_9GAMM|nr:ATP-binding protein [Alkalimonas collagenimarina]MDP4535505.1 ATP-binding protein [Alkalimonas collagenimarina]